jgi:hypothetical protein
MRGAAVQYSQDELAWIKARAQMARADLHALFAQTFGRVDVSVDNIKALCSRKGWTAGPEGRRRNKGKSLKFSGPEVNWLRQNGHLPTPPLHHRRPDRRLRRSTAVVAVSTLAELNRESK